MKRGWRIRNIFDQVSSDVSFVSEASELMLQIKKLSKWILFGPLSGGHPCGTHTSSIARYQDRTGQLIRRSAQDIHEGTFSSFKVQMVPATGNVIVLSRSNNIEGKITECWFVNEEYFFLILLREEGKITRSRSSGCLATAYWMAKLFFCNNGVSFRDSWRGIYRRIKGQERKWKHGVVKERFQKVGEWKKLAGKFRRVRTRCSRPTIGELKHSEVQ